VGGLSPAGLAPVALSVSMARRGGITRFVAAQRWRKSRQGFSPLRDGRDFLRFVARRRMEDSYWRNAAAADGYELRLFICLPGGEAAGAAAPSAMLATCAACACVAGRSRICDIGRREGRGRWGALQLLRLVCWRTISLSHLITFYCNAGTSLQQALPRTRPLKLASVASLAFGVITATWRQAVGYFSGNAIC